MATRYNLDFQTSDGTPFVAGEYRSSLKRLENVIRSLRSGTRAGVLGTNQVVAVKSATAASSATITIASSPAAGTALDINGTTFYFVNGSPNAAAGEADQSSGNTTTEATSLAAAINASASLANVLTASSATNVVTVTPVVSGLVTNAPVVRLKGVQAFATVTVSGGAAGDTCVINGTTITAVASGAVNNQYNIGANDAATATNLAAAINASTSALINQHVVARASGASGNVVTVAALYESLSGNCITLSATSHNTASSARLVNATEALANGVQATGAITFSGESGTVGAVVNGVSITFTANGTPATDAATLASSINSSTNALVQGIVFATSAAGVTTITSRMGGPQGNSITLTATGTGTTVSSAWGGGAVPSAITFSGAFGGWDPSLGGAHFSGGSETSINSYLL